MTTILYVEDDERQQRLLSKRLSRKGYTVILASNGQEGVEKAQAEKPGLILMDQGLPIMDGKEAMRTIKANEETKDIPIIALTAEALPGDREKAMEAGADEFHSKPVRFQGLIALIESLLAEGV